MKKILLLSGPVLTGVKQPHKNQELFMDFRLMLHHIIASS
jgi:hypothetical protein